MTNSHRGREGPVPKSKRDETIKRYLEGLERADYGALMELFAPDATVESPLYGVQLAADFYRELLKDTGSSVIKLSSVLHSTSGSSQSIGYFHYDWTLKDGSLVSFDCCDVFFFEREGRIQHLKIVYDTWLAREPHQRVSSVSNPGGVAATNGFMN